MQKNNFEANSFETSKSRTPSQGSVKVKNSKSSKRKTKKKLLIVSSLLAIFVTVFFLFILPALASAYEENYSRSIIIKQAGGSGASGRWIVKVDRDATSALGSTNPNARKGVIIDEERFGDSKGQYFDDKQHVAHSWKGPLAGHQPVRTDGTAFTESFDCVGVTPHIKIKAPTKTGYYFDGWKVAFTNGQRSVGGTKTFSKPVSYILNSSHTTPESVGKGIGSYYKDDYYYISAGCYAPGADGYYGKNMVITAQWKPIKYNISYTKNSGTLGNTSPTSATYGKKFNVSHPTRTGYTFNGWTITNYKNSTAKVNGTRHTARTWTDEKNKFGFLNLTYVNNATVNFEAEWTENKYNIDYDLDGGTYGSDHPISAKFSKTVTISNPSRTGYTFTGWSIDNYSPGVATVGGAEHTASSWTDEKGTKFSKLTTKSGGTVTFTAQWKKDNETGTTITVKYYDTYSGSAKLKGTGTYTYGNTYTLESAAALGMEHSGYEFKGWNFYRSYEDSNGDKGWLCQENPTVTYTYEGSPGNAINIGRGGTNLYIGESEGHGRTYWSNSGFYYAIYLDEASFKNQTKKGTIRLYSVWNPIEYKLKLDAHGGANNSRYTESYPDGFDVKVDRTDFNNLKNYIPTRSGYEFTGWYKSPADADSLNKSALIYEATGENTNDGSYWEGNKWKYAGNVTVYAGWKKTTYKLTLDANGGVNSSGYTDPLELDVILGDTTNNNISSYKPSRVGYEFDGWANYPSESEAPTVTEDTEDDVSEAEDTKNDVIPYIEVFDSDGANLADGIYWDEDGKWNFENDATVYAQWRLQQCEYKIQHFYQNTDGTYTEDTDGTFYGSGTYGATVEGVRNNYNEDMFTTPDVQTITLDLDSEKNVIKYYYNRKKYDYTIGHYYMDVEGRYYEKDDNVTVAGSAYYGSEITGELVPKTGFTSPEKQTITISADSTKNVIKYYYTRNKYDYTVEHYYMNVDGKGYTKDSDATATGAAYYGAEVTGELVPKTGFTSPSQKTITIGVNSSNNVIKYYYTRNKYDYVVKHYYMNLDGIHYTLDDNVTATGSAYYGTEVTGELVPKTGFTSPEKQTITISTSISNNAIKYYYVRASYVIRLYPNKPDNASASIEKKNPSGWAWDATNKCYSKKVFYGETYVLPETKDTFGLTGWTSSGWYKAGEFVGTGSKEWNLSSADGAIIELTPKWQANTYTVKLLSNKPSSASSEIQRSSLAGWDWNIVEKCYTTTFTYDSVELIPSISSPYSLTGWSVDKGWFNGDVNIGSGLKKWNLTAANGDSVSLSLTWVSNTYTVRLYENKPANATGTTGYKAPGGWSWNSSLKCYESTFKYDETNSVPSLTETFALKGWKAQNPCWSYVLPGETTENLSNGGTKIWNLTPSPGEVINFTSRFEPVKYTVILHPNKPFKASSEIVNKLADGTGGWTYKSDKDGYVKEFTYDLEELIPALADTYSLQGWHTTNGWYSKATDDINKAVWEEKAGVNIGSGSTTKWNLTSIDASVLDLYLDWEAYVYTLNFDYNVGALNYNSETEANLIVNGSKQDIERSREVSYDDKVGDLPLPSISGGIFIEWNDKQDGSGNTYTKDTLYRVVGDTTIYAQYKIITANMQINSNYRNGDENKSFTVNNLRAIDKYKFMHATRQYGFGLVDSQDTTRSYTDSLYNYVEAEKAYITDNANTYSCVGYNADKESHYDNNFTHKMNDNVSVLDLMYEYQALYNLENGAAAKTTFAEEYAYIKSNNLLNVDGKTFIVNAIWDAYPTVEVLPKSILQTDLAAMNIQEFEAKLKSFIKVTDSKPYATGDDEDGIYSDTNTKVSVSFPELSADKESLETLQSTGSASVTYCITDMVGNKTYNIVDIPVISQNPTKNYVARVDYYTRVINEQFYNEKDRYIANGVPYTIEESRRSGGLLPASKWYLDPDCRNLLTSAFETLRTDNEDGYVQIWKFNHEDVLAVQQYIKDNGIGNSKSDTALKNFCEQFAYCRKK